MDKVVEDAVLQALRLRGAAKAEALAILLSVYVDQEGHFNETPKNILAEILPHKVTDLRRFKDYTRAGVLVILLKKEGWIRNKQPVNGRTGDWYLNMERIGKVDDAACKAEAIRVVADLRKLYQPNVLREIASGLRTALEEQPS